MNEALLRHQMEQQGLDAVAVTSPENTEYFANFSVRTQLSIRDRLVIGLVPRVGERVLIVCDIEESLALARSGSSVVSYVEFATKPVVLLAETLKEQNLDKGTIGLEYRHLSVEDYEALQEMLPDARLVPVDGLLEQVRAIKTRDEIVAFRDNFANTEQGLISAWSSATLDATELEVEALMRRAFVEAGASGTRHVTVAFGKNAKHAHHTADSTRLKQGDIVRSDFGASFGRYATDMARMGVGGRPTPDLEAFHLAVYDVHSKLAESLRPGVVAANLYTRAVELFDEAGIAFDLPHIGHSLRIDGGHENPILHPHNPQTLEKDMLIALEPIARTPDGELCGTEDVYLIVEDGMEPLTGASNPRELFHIGG